MVGVKVIVAAEATDAPKATVTHATAKETFRNMTASW
jgi:hypothetical protein